MPTRWTSVCNCSGARSCGRAALERDMDDELRFHLESRAAELARSGVPQRKPRAARASSSAPSKDTRKVAARRAACACSTNCAATRATPCASCARAPSFALTAVVTLALGIGANTAIFSAVKAVLLNQLPYRDPDRLVKLGEADAGSKRAETIGYTTAYDWRRLSHSFESMSLYRDASGAIVERGEPELVNGLRVNYDFFDTLGMRMQIGRGFLPEEDRPDRRYEVDPGARTLDAAFRRRSEHRRPRHPLERLRLHRGGRAARQFPAAAIFRARRRPPRSSNRSATR